MQVFFILFYLYGGLKVYADIRGGSSGRGRQIQYMLPQICVQSPNVQQELQVFLVGLLYFTWL